MNIDSLLGQKLSPSSEEQKKMDVSRMATTLVLLQGTTIWNDLPLKMEIPNSEPDMCP